MRESGAIALAQMAGRPDSASDSSNAPIGSTISSSPLLLSGGVEMRVVRVFGRTDPAGDPLQLARFWIRRQSVRDLDLELDQVGQSVALQAPPDDLSELVPVQRSTDCGFGADGVVVPLNLHDLIPPQLREFIQEIH